MLDAKSNSKIIPILIKRWSCKWNTRNNKDKQLNVDKQKKESGSIHEVFFCIYCKHRYQIRNTKNNSNQYNMLKDMLEQNSKSKSTSTDTSMKEDKYDARCCSDKRKWSINGADLEAI